VKIICGGRRSGKTTQLIKYASEKGLYIVCGDKKRVEVIAKQAKEMGLDLRYPICLQELPLRGRFIENVCVDDTEYLLERIIGKHIDVITIDDSEILKLSSAPKATMTNQKENDHE